MTSFPFIGPINKALKKFNAGLHLKTAGTTWLEELTGLALAGGEGLAIAKEIYAKSLSRIDELCQPYATVIDIKRSELPAIQMLISGMGRDLLRLCGMTSRVRITIPIFAS